MVMVKYEEYERERERGVVDGLEDGIRTDGKRGEREKGGKEEEEEEEKGEQGAPRFSARLRASQ